MLLVNLMWGTAHASVSPIFGEVVLSDARESMNRVKKGFFLVRKGSYTTFNIVKIRKIWEKKGKIRKTRSMTKKEKKSEIFTLKVKMFFRKKTSFRNVGQRKILSVPPNSAPGLRHCIATSK